MTDRDHFASAALTGLLAQGDDGSFSEESYVRGAYRWADAMLRERAKTNHDAAPAARASVESVAPQPTTRGDSDRADKAAPRPSEGTGDTTEPVAWGVASRTGLLATSISRIDAVDMQSEYERDTAVVPLYRSPTLTGAEWEAVLAMACHCDTRSGLEWVRLSATLRGLLARLA